MQVTIEREFANTRISIGFGPLVLLRACREDQGARSKRAPRAGRALGSGVFRIRLQDPFFRW